MTRARRAARPPAVAPVQPPRLRWRAVLIVLAGALTYWNSLSGPFVFDDRGSILDNHTIEKLWDPSVFSAPHETPVAGRPVVNVSFALNYALGGRDVRGYHAGNVAVHLLCALLVFGIVRRTLQLPANQARFGRAGVDMAFAAALIWAVHPLNTEVVNYLTQRTESLMALFYLLVLYAGIRAIDKRVAGRRRLGWEAIAVVSSALGMACKESMATVPLVILLYDRVFVFDSLRRALRDRWPFYTALAATWLVLAAMMWTAPRTLSAGFAAHDAAPWTYLLNQTVLLTRYLWLAVWPRSLTLYYGWPQPLTLGDVWPHALLIVSLLVVTIVALVREPRLGFLGAWFFITLAPTSSIIPIATEVGAERRMYLPLIALIVLGVVGAVRLWRIATVRRVPPHASTAARPAVTAMAALAVVATLLAARTIGRNSEYASSLRLAETTFERWPSPAAHSMLGMELAAASRFDEAESHLRAAAPDFPPARYYLATVLARQGQPEEAIARFQEFISSQPPLLDQVHLARAQLADLFMKDQRWVEAAEQYRLMLAARPYDLEARALLANALVRQHSYAEAIALYRTYLAERPRDVLALGGLGVALASAGRMDEAISAFHRAVDLDPSNSRARQNLARALMGRGELAEASRHAQEAVRLSPQDPAPYELLGGILASEGRFDEARQQFERALQLDPGSPARHALEVLKRSRQP